MITRITEQQTKIKFDMPYSLYPYGNYLKFGLDKDNFSIYKCNKSLFSKYDDSIQIISKTLSKKDALQIKDFCSRNKIRNIWGSEKAITLLGKILDSAVIKYGEILKLDFKEKEFKRQSLTAKKEDEFKSIARLVYNENIKKNPDFVNEKLYFKQIYERFKLGYTRNLYLKDKDETIATVATYSETNEYAVVGGLVVKEEYRRQHIGSTLFIELLNQLSSEKKKIYLYCFNKDILNFYLKFTTKRYKCGSIYLR